MGGTEYYRLLATTLPPVELGSAAWRRLRRTALRRVRQLRPRARVLDLPRHMKVACLDDLAQRMRTVRAGRGPVEPDERAEARHLLTQHLPNHARHCCERADRVLAGQAHLFGLWRDHARGELAPGIAAFDWTRNPLSGAHAPMGPSSAIDRDAPGTDSRALWEIARFAHVCWLAQAHAVAGLPGTVGTRGWEEKGIYARAAVLHIRDFLALHPVGQGIHWTCPMEAALRVIHLSLALVLLRDAPELDALFWGEVTAALVQHAWFIDDELEDAQMVPGNHLLTDLAGLATIGCLFPELPDALHWRAWAVPAFSRELLRQTSEDGLAFEASLPYHRFATELALAVQSFARRQGLSLGAPALGRLWRMCGVCDAATLPDGRLPGVGDNDSTHAFAVEPRGSLETDHLSALRAALGGPGIPRSVEPESLWLGGLAGLRRNVAHAAGHILVHRPANQRFTVSGLAVLHDSRGRAATLWAGDNGQHGLGGHAHNDKLSTEIVLRGCRLVVDPGCPVYLADPNERDRYRSTAAHPTVQVDRLEQAPIPFGRPFLLPEAARASMVRTEGDAAWAEHCAYVRLRPSVIHRREVALPPELEAICVTDWLLGDGVHVVDAHWPLATREVCMRRASAEERAILARLEALPYGSGRFDLDRIFALALPRQKKTCAIVAIGCEQPWEGALLESTWSPGYGERICGRTVRIRARAQCPVAITSAFAWVAG